MNRYIVELDAKPAGSGRLIVTVDAADDAGAAKVAAEAWGYTALAVGLLPTHRGERATMGEYLYPVTVEEQVTYKVERGY